jgi:glycerol-3-phosphate dehydrogenase
MSQRGNNIRGLEESTLDVLIIGGGINGAVSAAALSARGVRVGLIDARDFAGFTSQHSSNLIWGGIKYMEGHEFGLVADLCKARNELMRRYPANIREIRFLTTVSRDFRHHPLMLWAGAWLYWLIGRGYTRIPRYLGAADIGAAEPAVDVSRSAGGIEYSDAFLCDNDARFVFRFVRSALDRGCLAANYLEAGSMERDAGGWRTSALDHESGREIVIRSRVVINAAGAFVDSLNTMAGIATGHSHVLSKGIHLLVPRIGESDRIMAFFADDGRLFFAIPMANRTCIGTTDTRVGSPQTRVTDEDREFVLANINDRLSLPVPLTRDDVIAERCGVRPLVVARGAGDDGDFLKLSRKHVVETSIPERHISIFGGKLTDCINIGEEICDRVAGLGVSLNPQAACWYGEPDESEHQAFLDRVRSAGLGAENAADTGEPLSQRLWRRYGSDALAMVERVAKDRTLAEPAIAGTGFRRCEIEYIREREMVVRLEDLVRRRSRVALLYRQEELRNLPGLRETCEILFGDRAQSRLDEYFQSA